jgi:hypothetical protein
LSYTGNGRRRFQGFPDFVEPPLKQPLDGLPQILQQVPTIGDLHGFGRRFGSRLSVG